jgi:hypothetical protein
MSEEKIVEKSTYIRILNKDGRPILRRSFLPEGSKIIIEEIERDQEVPWEGTLFNMGAMVKDRIYIGHVVREAQDVVVVFSDTDAMRWDLPKKLIKVVGKNVFLDMTMDEVRKYEVSTDSPLPPTHT